MDVIQAIRPSRNAMLTFVTIVGLLLIGLLIFLLVNEDDDPRRRGSSRLPTTTSNPSAAVKDPHGVHEDGGGLLYTPGAPAPPNAKARTAALGFMTSFLRRDLPKSQWLAQFQPYCSPDFIDKVLATIDPRRVPTTSVSGEPVVESSHTDSVRYRIRTGAADYRIVVFETHDTWLVTSMEVDEKSAP